jgi:hypothetical protein
MVAMSESDSVRIRNDALAEHAAEIRKLGKRAVQDIIEIGRRLTEAKKILGWGNWLPWLEREFGWSERTAQNFMRVAELAESATVADLNVDLRGLYLLASPSIRERHPEIIEAVAERSARGEPTTSDEIKRAAGGIRITGTSTNRPATITVTPTTAAELHAQIRNYFPPEAPRETEVLTLTPELALEVCAQQIIRGFGQVSHQLDRAHPAKLAAAVVKLLVDNGRELVGTGANLETVREALAFAFRLKHALDQAAPPLRPVS